MQFKMQDMMSWAWREDKALWALFKLLGSQYTIWVKCRMGKFGIKLVLIELKLMCKLYTIRKIIKLTFECNLQS